MRSWRASYPPRGFMLLVSVLRLRYMKKEPNPQVPAPLSSQTVSLIVLGAIIVIGVIWYLAAGPNTKVAQAPGTTATSTLSQATGTPAATPPAKTAVTGTQRNTQSAGVPAPARPAPTVAGVDSLEHLRLLKQTLSCHISTQTGISRTGTAYLASNALRINLNDGVSMIDDGTTLYTWAVGATSGLKLLAASSVSGSAIAARGGIDPLVPVSYQCYPWTGDESLFTPPASVTFTDTSGN